MAEINEATMRNALYFTILLIPISIPMFLGWELVQSTSENSGAVIRGVAAITRLTVADGSLVGDLTPAAAAGALAMLAVRPISTVVSILTIGFSVFGWLCFAWLSVHTQGSTVFLDRSLLPVIELALEGNVERTTLTKAVTSIGDFSLAMRVFYLMVAASAFGFLINESGRNEPNS